jgi:hypothetical protein
VGGREGGWEGGDREGWQQGFWGEGKESEGRRGGGVAEAADDPVSAEWEESGGEGGGEGGAEGGREGEEDTVSSLAFMDMPTWEELDRYLYEGEEA